MKVHFKLKIFTTSFKFCKMLAVVTLLNTFGLFLSFFIHPISLCIAHGVKLVSVSAKLLICKLVVCKFHMPSTIKCFV